MTPDTILKMPKAINKGFPPVLGNMAMPAPVVVIPVAELYMSLRTPYVKLRFKLNA